MLSTSTITQDFKASIVVFLVALPLCLGIALASGAPLFAGLIAGIIGGVVVGSISGSHTSVSGPAAGLTAIVTAQIAALGSFEAFLYAVFVAGLIQLALGYWRAGALSRFFPSSVIKGLLAAIGVILILKQIPHVLGDDKDPEGDMSFKQPDHETTFSEFSTILEGDWHAGAMVIGAISILVLVFWDRIKLLKQSIIPGPLVVVLLGVLINRLFLSTLGTGWLIEGASHLVTIPVAESAEHFLTFFQYPDFSQWNHQQAYLAAATIAIVASLESLLNLEAVDKLDKLHRESPASRELVAQGIGNMVAGLLGGLPVTSVVVRGSVNVSMGAQTKLSTIMHGIFLAIAVALLPMYLNMIPLASLAAILLVTGFKLASPKLFRQMWREGLYQFAPFIITLVAIVYTDLLKGILIGLATSLVFILRSNLRNPIKRVLERHPSGDILHIQLAPQVSFLNRASLDEILNKMEAGQNVLIDASDTDYIDPDILSLLREFKEHVGPARNIKVSLRGFRQKYELQDESQFADYSTHEVREQMTPEQVLDLLLSGNERFRTGNQVKRDFSRQIIGTSQGQNPVAAVLSCIDSRVPVELVFDLGIGDIFSIRVAGNVLGANELGSIEFGVVKAGVKLVLVMGHTRCGAVTASVETLCDQFPMDRESLSPSLQGIVDEIGQSMDNTCQQLHSAQEDAQEGIIDEVAERNVLRTVSLIQQQSEAIRRAVEAGDVLLVGAIYDVGSGAVTLVQEKPHSTNN